MNKYESLAITIIFLVVSFISSAQVAVGQWQDHFSYNNGKQIIVVDNTIYMISENGILKYNKDNSEIEKLTKINYLSDITPSAIAYDEQTKNIIIGYSSGNIEKKKKNEIAKNGIAYIGCDFGIVTIDIKRVEVKETWFFGNNGSYVHVNDMDFNDNDIYVATTTGVYKGNIDENLVDFSKWTELSDAEQPPLAWMKGGNYNTLKYFQDKLIVNYKSPQENNDTIMAYDGTTWTHVINDRRFTNNISGNNDTLICSTGSALYTYGRNLESTGEYWFYKTEYSWINTNATHAIIYDDKIWIADKENGLCWIKDNTGGIIDINSPQSNKVFDISSSKSRIMAVNGGYISSLVPTWKSLQLYIYENYEWKTKTTSNFPELAEMTDFVSITFDPNDEKRYFLCSWTKGLVEFRQDQFYKSYNETNSTMVPIDGSEMIRTGSAAFDGNGNLWVTNSLASKCLHVMTKEGRWTGFSFPNMVKNITKLIVTSSGKKWMVLGQSGGLFVFDDNGTPEDKTDDRYKHLTVCNENGETVSNDVYSIAEDKNGYIWVGTAKGVVVYYNPDKVFDNSTFWGRQIKVPRNDGTDNADILLSADVVTAICVDGANNKWFGTQNGGAYYTSSDGIETIHNFNTTNSAIPSDNILAISIVPETGDVFFATPKGIISYRGTATEGSETYDEILAFPNPVRSDYYGPITIKGLVAGSIVKIADIAGNIVYEAKSTGGQLVWDGRNLNGNRVASGVYIVFASTEIGEQKSTTKILFLK